MNDYFALLAGFGCAGIGGELFLRGVAGLGRSARISPGIIGATVGAFATSSPELSVSISAAVAGRPGIAFGDALGSNIVNVALILGLALLISGIHCTRDSVGRDFPVALLVPVTTGILLLDGELSRFDGLLMICLFVAWLAAAAVDARKQRSAAPTVLSVRHHWVAVVSGLAGLAFLLAAGSLIVAGATGVAVSFGVEEFIIGATVVAIGTSVPELATTVFAKLRGHDEIGLGVILGSNIFNGLFIVGVAASIHPVRIGWRGVAVALVFGLVAVLFAYPARSGYIERRRGVVLLVLYIAYVVAALRVKAA